MLKQKVKDQQMLKQKIKDQKVKDQKVKEVRSPNQKVLDQRGQDLSWKINRWENPIIISIAFGLLTNETYFWT